MTETRKYFESKLCCCEESWKKCFILIVSVTVSNSYVHFYWRISRTVGVHWNANVRNVFSQKIFLHKSDLEFGWHKHENTSSESCVAVKNRGRNVSFTSYLLQLATVMCISTRRSAEQLVIIEMQMSGMYFLFLHKSYLEFGSITQTRNYFDWKMCCC